MLIDEVFPQVVAAKSTVKNMFDETAMGIGIPKEVISSLHSAMPPELQQVGCFLDKMTNTWRYEYGSPYVIDQQLVWGTHMWLPVCVLVWALRSVHDRLSSDQRSKYFERLVNPDKHLDTLVEMYPVFRLCSEVKTQFEVQGAGSGDTTIDWIMESDDGSLTLFDVKHRQRDLIELMNRINQDQQSATMPPDHDANLLFRSVEKKFLRVCPNYQLQGVWIVTNIKQEEGDLIRIFDALDKEKIHFAILGDWRDDVHLLVRRPEDKKRLLKQFGIRQSNRFLHRQGTIMP